VKREARASTKCNNTRVLYSFHHIHAFDHLSARRTQCGSCRAREPNLPENDVPAVQPSGGHSCDKKLAAVGVGTGVGHRKHSGHLQRELNQERGSRLYSGIEGGVEVGGGGVVATVCFSLKFSSANFSP
jgi:hypothetical protein